MSRWEDALDGALAELSESPLPGARYAYEVVRRRFQPCVVAPIPQASDLRVYASRVPDADWPSPGYLTPEPDLTGSEYRAGE